ncbi:hypothetical protein EJB05_02571, partial [Eragrostis curvula]
MKHPQPCTSRSSRTRTPSPDGGAARLGLLIGCGGVHWARRTTLPAPSLLRPRLAPLPICQCELPAQDTKSGAGSALRLLATSSRPTCLTCSSRPAAETEQDRIASAAVPLAEHFALVMGRKPNHSCEELASQRTAEAQNADKERLMDQKLERMNALAHIVARIVSSPNSTSGNELQNAKEQDSKICFI